MSLPTAAYRFALLAICLFVPALQADWITESELHKSCDAFVAEPESLEGTSCLAFVQGFLLSAERFRAAKNDSAAKETFSERAMRTRLSATQLQRIESSTSQPYCIDETTPVAEVLEAIRNHLSSTGQESSLISTATLQQALSRSFPCDS